MSDNVYKKIEIVGTSSTGLDDAIQNAVNKAAQTVRRMGWFEVDEIRGAINEGKVAQWQVTVKIGFTLED
jgi:flavin-binding protein dodecin